jgi:hypothetical protein
MSQRPKLKPAQGYAFRLILCEEHGNTITDDFKMPVMAMEVARRLMSDMAAVHKIAGTKQ